MTPSTDERPIVSEHEAYVKNMALMNHIVAEMKEVAVLPSEVATDVNPLLKVEFPEGGGVLTYMGGHDHPYKGFPFFEFVDKIDVIKKVMRGTMSSLFHSFQGRSKFSLALLALVPWLFGDLVKAYVYTFYRMIERFRFKTIRYCDAMREVHRAFSIPYEGESAESAKMRGMVRDIFCMFLENDNAYRFRFQDVIVSLNKETLQENAGKEVVRLLDLMVSRETTQEIRDTWKLVKFFLPLYLRSKRSLNSGIVSVLGNLDLEKVSLSIEDQHYCKERKDYKFAFMK